MSPQGGGRFDRRRGRALGKGSLGASIALHAAVLAILFWIVPTLRSDPVLYRAVRIDMVAAPATIDDELVVETPDEPEPAPPEPAPVAVEVPDPESDTAETIESADPEPVAQAPATSEADDPRDGDDQANVRIEAQFSRDYPEYYENITNQIRRCFRPVASAGRPVAIRFDVTRDGATANIDVAESSGSFSFDVDASGAVECAGRSGRLGPLPEEYPWDRLPIMFTISPRNPLAPATGDAP